MRPRPFAKLLGWSIYFEFAYLVAIAGLGHDTLEAIKRIYETVDQLYDIISSGQMVSTESVHADKPFVDIF